MSQCYRQQLVEAMRQVLPGQFFRGCRSPEGLIGRRSAWRGRRF